MKQHVRWLSCIIVLLVGDGWAFASIFADASEKELLGIWIETKTYKTTIELFDDGDGRWNDGTFIEWKLREDGSIKLVSGGQHKKIFIGDAKNLDQRQLFIEGSEYLPYDPALSAAYTALATSIASQSTIRQHLDLAKTSYEKLRNLRGRSDGGGTMRQQGRHIAKIHIKGNIEEAKRKANEAIASCREYAEKAIRYAPLFSRSYIVKAQCLDSVHESLRFSGQTATQLSSGQLEDLLEQQQMAIAEAIEARVAAINAGLTTDWRAATFNSLAWTHATREEGQVLNGHLAVAYAKQSLELEPGDVNGLDTLAAAYARMEDYDMAVATQTKAIESLPPDREGELSDFEARLKLYLARKPYTDLD